MAKILSKVANWLYLVLQPQYLHKEVAYSHLYHFLAAYLTQGFKIRTAVYTSVLGHSQLLINLYGKLDCGTCLVPLNIWIPLNYPFQDENIPTLEPNGVPVVFVVPEHGLMIRPNNNVDSQGRFYHPFMALWHQNYTPTAQTRDFSLLLLMTCLKVTFEQNPPLNTRPEPPAAPPKVQPTNTGPQLPPKMSYNETPVQLPTPEPPRRETNGPPLPQKPVEAPKPVEAQPTQDTSIPEKYRMPLPLPPQDSPSPAPVQSPPQLSGPPPQVVYQDNSELYEPRRLRPQGPGKPPIARKVQSTENPQGINEVEDLMDKVTLNENKGDRPILQMISDKINEFLASEESLVTAAPFVEQQKLKIEALENQLLSHLKQAHANEENLQNHITYVQGQVESIRKLNEELQQVDQINAESKDEVAFGTGPGQKIKLEDIVTPDSILVNQLYDTVADIKAHKDTIDLVGGNFKGESELINDENMDQCIKSVRGLARELFWLEVTKTEIGKSMGLQM